MTMIGLLHEKTSWTNDDLIAFEDAIRKHGWSNWVVIAQTFPGQTKISVKWAMKWKDDMLRNEEKQPPNFYDMIPEAIQLVVLWTEDNFIALEDESMVGQIGMPLLKRPLEEQSDQCKLGLVGGGMICW